MVRMRRVSEVSPSRRNFWTGYRRIFDAGLNPDIGPARARSFKRRPSSKHRLYFLHDFGETLLICGLV